MDFLLSPSLKFAEKVLNIVLGLSFYSWGVLGIIYSLPEDRFSIVRIIIVIFHFIMGSFILFRREIKTNSSLGHIIMCLPSIINAGIAFRLAESPHAWPWYAQAIFASGALFTIISFIFLGKNFAILPCVRDISIHGPYGIIRHPGYAGEFVMLIGCAASTLSPIAFFLVLIAIPFMILRIQAEETVLSTSAEYNSYKRRVRFRLLPGIW